MAKLAVIEPDLQFKQKILGLGGHDLTSCYQCGTCSVVCPISTDSDPFPRKEMIWAQWGLKEKLLADPTVWLCHQCSVCNAYCPRDAKPADVMAALRDYTITHYAVPSFMGVAVSEPKYLPFLFAVPVVVLLAVLAGLNHLTTLPEGEVIFSKFLPIGYVETTFTVAVGLAVLAAVASGLRYFRSIEAHAEDRSFGSQNIIGTVMDILKHRRFRQCDEEAVGTKETFKSHLNRTHLAVFYGFAGLVVTTASVGIGIYAFGYLTPWPVWHPVKILGNVSGIAVIAASIVFLYRRLADKEKAGKSTYSDWLFLTVLGVTTLTGFLSELVRLAGSTVAYGIYFVHLVFIFFLLVYLPYSKFAHLVYRFVAMLYASGRLPGDPSRS